MNAWYVVYTKPKKERYASSNLAQQGYAVYLPSHRCTISHARRIEIVDRPLFPRYLFVSMNPTRDAWRAILSTMGVSDLVRAADRPLRVPDGVVDTLREHEARRVFDRVLPPARSLKIGAPVRILSGPFAGLMGTFSTLASAQRVIVLLNLLGRDVSVRVPDRAVAAG